MLSASEWIFRPLSGRLLSLDLEQLVQFSTTTNFRPLQFSTTEVLYLLAQKWNFPNRNILIIVNRTNFSQCNQRNVKSSIIARWSKIGLVENWWWSKIGTFALYWLDYLLLLMKLAKKQIHFCNCYFLVLHSFCYFLWRYWVYT